MSINKDGLNELCKIRRESAIKSIRNFTLTYLSSHVKDYKFSKAHEEIFEILQKMSNERGQKAAIAAPRGIGKSTIISLAAVLHGVCSGREKFIAIFSETADSAQQIMENIKKELTENRKLAMDFPDVFESEGSPRPPRWTATEIETRNGVKVKVFGSNQSPRGVKFGKERPSLVVLDDLESFRNTNTKDVRDKLRSWFLKAVLNIGTEKTNYIFLGNIHHSDCLLAEFTNPDKQPNWTSRIYKAIISEPKNKDCWERWATIFYGKPNCTFENQSGPEAAKKYFECCKHEMLDGVELLWPERWQYYDLRLKYEEDPISFKSEYQNEPLDPNTRIFNVDEFKFWNENYSSKDALIRSMGQEAEFIGACDPSMGDDLKRGDYSAIVIIGWDKNARAMYVVEADIRRRKPDQLIEDIIAFHSKYRFRKFAMEANSGQEFLIQQLEKRCADVRKFIPVERIKNSQNKIQRIQSIQPLTKSILQFSKEHRLLLEELRDFPKADHDDGPDALEMAIRISENYQPQNSIDNWTEAEIRSIFEAANGGPISRGRKITVGGFFFNDEFGLFNNLDQFKRK
jgi:predicted phage terminase large subunit-like protein